MISNLWDIQLFKDEESITDWNDNQPKLENIKGNDKVFGLFTRDEQSMSEDLQVPVNALVSYQMVKDGIAVFDLKLPEGKILFEKN